MIRITVCANFEGDLDEEVLVNPDFIVKAEAVGHIAHKTAKAKIIMAPGVLPNEYYIADTLGELKERLDRSRSFQIQRNSFGIPT